MLSVVVPVYNEEHSLPELHRRLAGVLAAVGSHEIVLVDDGSTDDSWWAMQRIATVDPNVRLIRLSRNFGHQAAITAGLDAAIGDAVITMDADLQDPPELIPALVAQRDLGYDVVYAVRATRAGERRWRLVAIASYYRLLRRIAGHDIPANAGDFRLVSRRVVEALAAMPERARYLRGMTSWVGFKQTSVLYERDARFAGASKYPLRKLVRLGLDGIISFSTVPMQIVTWIGFVLVAICAALLGWSLCMRLFTSSVPHGWTSLLVVVVLLGGVQMLSLGIIGQYIARIFDEAKSRPLYFVSESYSTVSESPTDTAPTIV